MRYGVFGGSFDPVHYGHLLLAESCREQCPLDHVFFVPSGIPPHKQDLRRTTGDVRATMLELAIADVPEFSVLRFEIDRPNVSFTVDTLRFCHTLHPMAEWFLLLGTDMFRDLPNWRSAEEVVRLAVPIVAERPEKTASNGPLPDGPFSTNPRYHSTEYVTEWIRTVRTAVNLETRSLSVSMPESGISSTEIRRRVAKKRSIRFWTPSSVVEYIETERLY